MKNDKIDELKINDKQITIKPTIVSMKATKKPEEKNITDPKFHNKVPTNFEQQEDNKHTFEDITGDTSIKSNNALNENQSLTPLSKLYSNIHADSIIEDDIKSDDQNSKPLK